MNNNFGVTCLISLTMIAALCVINLSAQEAQSHPRADLSFSSLTLEISTGKKKPLLLEPISITIILSNRTGEPVLGHSAIGFSDNHLDLYVSPAGGQLRKIDRLSPLRKQLVVTPRPILPGESYETSGLITLDMKPLFPVSGNYQIQAVLHDTEGKSEIRSNILNVQVVEPWGRDYAALQFIESKDNASSYFSGMGLVRSKKAQDELEKLASDFSDSPYADYANYLLGEVFFFKEDYGKANEKFSKLTGKTDFAHAKKVKEYLREIKDKLPSAQGN